MRTITTARCLTLLAAITAGTTLAQTARYWSDARLLPSESRTAQDLERAKAWSCPGQAPDLNAAREAVKKYEQMVAGIKPDDPNRAAYLQALDAMKQGLAAQANVKPPAPPKPASLDVALANADAYLRKNATAGLKAFAASADAKTFAKANATAAAASLLGKPQAALTALLAAHKLNPKDAQTLVNLGGALTTLGLNVEALAALDAADKLKPANSGALGLGDQAVALNNRGLALLRTGRAPEAEKALTQAVRLAPNLSEANLTLARALACQGKTAAAAKAYQAGMRRSVQTPTKPIQTTPPQDSPTTDETTDTSARTQLPAERLFDTSRGANATMPDLKLPLTPAEAVELYPGYKKLYDELGARSLALGKKLNEVEAKIRARKPADPVIEERRDNLWWAILKASDAPSITAIKKRKDKTGAEVARIWGNMWHCESGCTIDNIISEAGKSPNYKETFRGLCIPATSSTQNTWRGALHNHIDEASAYLKATYRIHTALAANYSDPLWHERASLWAEQLAVIQFSSVVHDALLWSSDVKQYRDGCVEGGEQITTAKDLEAKLELPRTSPCKQLFDGLSASVSVHVVSLSINCDSVSIGAATPGWIGAYGTLTQTFESNEYTVAVGIQETASAPGGIASVGSQQGAYVTWGDKGLVDAGVQITTSASVGASKGPVSGGKDVASGLTGALSGKWSFIASSGSKI